MELEKTEANFLTGDSLDPREGIISVEETIKAIPGAYIGDSDRCPLKHSFSDGIYVREIFIPAGDILVGKIHKHEHPNFLMSGEVEVFTENDGLQTIKAPCSMISSAGTKRTLRAKTDLVWITVHSNPTNTTDLDELEEEVIANSFLEYDEFRKKEDKKLDYIKKNNLYCRFKNYLLKIL